MSLLRITATLANGLDADPLFCLFCDQLANLHPHLEHEVVVKIWDLGFSEF
jgi:hypothetical protein